MKGGGEGGGGGENSTLTFGNKRKTQNGDETSARQQLRAREENTERGKRKGFQRHFARTVVLL